MENRMENKTERQMETGFNICPKHFFSKSKIFLRQEESQSSSNKPPYNIMRHSGRNSQEATQHTHAVHISKLKLLEPPPVKLI